MPSWLLDWKQKCGNSSLKGTMMTFLWVFFYQIILCCCMTMCIEYLFQMAFTTHFVYIVKQTQRKSYMIFLLSGQKYLKLRSINLFHVNCLCRKIYIKEFLHYARELLKLGQSRIQVVKKKIMLLHMIYKIKFFFS